MINKEFVWDEKKNVQLRKERGITFEDVVIAMAADGLLDIIEHPNKKRYPNQKVFIVAMDDYVYLIPFVENDKQIFLKTIIPSRKAVKNYFGR